MEHIRKYNRFNESVSSIKEIKYDESYIVKCMMIMNLIERTHFNERINILGNVIKDTLTEDTFNKLFADILDILKNGKNIFISFITSVVGKDDLLRMFNNVVVHEGGDLEDEWVASLLVNNRIVLLLASPDRGNSVWVEGDDSISTNELISILKELCNYYNKNF